MPDGSLWRTTDNLKGVFNDKDVYGPIDTKSIKNDPHVAEFADNYQWFAVEAFWSQNCKPQTYSDAIGQEDVDDPICAIIDEDKPPPPRTGTKIKRANKKPAKCKDAVPNREEQAAKDAIAIPPKVDTCNQADFLPEKQKDGSFNDPNTQSRCRDYCKTGVCTTKKGNINPPKDSTWRCCCGQHCSKISDAITF